MHGGSGVSHEDYRRVIELGVRKINYYTYMAKAGGAAVSAMTDKTFFRDVEVEAIKAMSREELAEFAKASDYPESIIEKLNVEGKEKAFSTWVVKMYQDSLNK